MPRTARVALAGAGGLLLLLACEWFLVFHVGSVQHVDASIYYGFHGLASHPLVSRLAVHIASLCNPDPYVFLAAAPVVVALWRRRTLLAGTIVVILAGASLTTQFLKPLLAAARPDGLPVWQMGNATWPSGHATASMALALCAVLAAPARWRPVVAALGALFAVAVCFSFLTLGWHYPSDALAGLLIASIWTLVGIAAVSAVDARRHIRAEFGADPAVRAGLPHSGLAVGAAAALTASVVLLHPGAVAAYARGHVAFVLGAMAIAAAGLSLPAAVLIAIRGRARPRRSA